MEKRQLISGCGLLFSLTVSVLAEQGGMIRREEPPVAGNEIERSAVNFAEAWRPRGTTGVTRVVGSVIDIRQIPVPGATVQLRNLDTGNVEQTAESDGEGSYAFELSESGTFVVEMVMVDGYIVALSNAGSLARFETLQTVVQLPGRWDFNTRNLVISQNMVNYFGMSAETSMTATTVTIAADTNVTPTDPGVPVSPVSQ